ncbi:hypothetical protein GGX14DRAFT_393957 [Mycena pura]|uniref:Uncharacterized protein n=1 Tax=Mycena pura TaxID=153505 RepID=A0AAD6VJA2_9AGAR|nr:hypothetical protein GGX14DRAFT_393957 [Mycena pura]
MCPHLAFPRAHRGGGDGDGRAVSATLNSAGLATPDPKSTGVAAPDTAVVATPPQAVPSTSLSPVLLCLMALHGQPAPCWSASPSASIAHITSYHNYPPFEVLSAALQPRQSFRHASMNSNARGTRKVEQGQQGLPSGLQLLGGKGLADTCRHLPTLLGLSGIQTRLDGYSKQQYLGTCKMMGVDASDTVVDTLLGMGYKIGVPHLAVPL